MTKALAKRTSKYYLHRIALYQMKSYIFFCFSRIHYVPTTDQWGYWRECKSALYHLAPHSDAWPLHLQSALSTSWSEYFPRMEWHLTPNQSPAWKYVRKRQSPNAQRTLAWIMARLIVLKSLWHFSPMLTTLARSILLFVPYEKKKSSIVHHK